MKNQLKSIASFFIEFQLFNAIIVGQSEVNFVVYSFNAFAKFFYEIKSDGKLNIGELFPDRLKNLEGRSY